MTYKSNMRCPQCKSENTKVLETRNPQDNEIRRRRSCLDCNNRFTTVETLLLKYPYVVKKDGRREPFDQTKLRKGVQLACIKRPVSLPQIEDIVDAVTQIVLKHSDKEMRSDDIGYSVMMRLKNLDHVAYVRFASVYRSFKDVGEFVKTLESAEGL
jgi:transcriptional repressor NrdR